MSLKAKIEAVIYASEEPVTLAQLSGLLGQEAQAELDYRDSQQLLPLDESNPEVPIQADVQPDGDQITETLDPSSLISSVSNQARQERERARRLRDFFRSLLDELIRDYASPSSDRGLEIREVAGGFRLATKPEYHDAVRGFVRSLKPPLKLSLQALETLAVIAYKQPVTAPEIADIRGVDSGGVLGSLMARKLITTAGRKAVIGRPILYKTTRDFLLRFGLKDLSELPSIEEFEKMASELAESIAEPQQEIKMPEHDRTSDLQAEHGAISPQSDGDPTPLNATSDQNPTPDGSPTDPPNVRLSDLPPASTVPGTDDDPTEATLLARQQERDRQERTYPQEGSIPSLQPK